MIDELFEIPEKYNTIEEKLQFLKEEHIREKERDRMDMDYSYKLYKTEKYWENKLQMEMTTINQKQQIDFNEFLEIEKKLEIKYGTITNVEDVPKSDKLIKLIVDFGDNDIRTVVTNIKPKLIDPSLLINEGSFFITNLKSVKMMGIESQAMILPLMYNESFIWTSAMRGSKLI